MGDRRFRRGRVFVTQNCTLKCRCRKNGIPRCAPLCKTKRKVPVCGPNERLAEILDLFAGGRCKCQTKTCISTSSKWTRELCCSAKQTWTNTTLQRDIHCITYVWFNYVDMQHVTCCKMLDGSWPGMCHMLHATVLHVQYFVLKCCMSLAGHNVIKTWLLKVIATAV